LKIGIIGSGVVGQTLGTGLAALGHEVKIGSREPNSEKLLEWQAKTGDKASTGTFAETATFGDMAIIATLWDGTEHALQLSGPDSLAGKVVIDATNPLKFGPKGPELAIGFSESAGEHVQNWLPQAKVVKAFNIVTAPLMVNPGLLGETPDMFICGNDEAAKQEVTDLLTTMGWPTIDLGTIEESRLIEPIGMAWVKYYFKTQNWQHAFKLIRK